MSRIQIEKLLYEASPPKRTRTMPRKTLTFFPIIITLIAIVFFLRSRYFVLEQVDATPSAEVAKGIPFKNSSDTNDISWLSQRFPDRFKSPIRYAFREILAVPNNGSTRPSLTTMDEPLFDSKTPFVEIDPSKMQTLPHNAYKEAPLELPVAHAEKMKVGASNLILGTSTMIGRLWDSLKDMERWLPYTGARLFVVVKESDDTPANEDEMRDIEEHFIERGINVTLMHPLPEADATAFIRYLSLISIMYDARDANTEWLVTIDDDTFFPSLHNIEKMLSQYDHTKQQYLGALSETWWSMDIYGLMAFGGAGIFYSLPLAEVIAKHTKSGECIADHRLTSGDGIVMNCIYQHSTTKLTVIHGLHQIDIWDDISGFFESGREMLSLHHLKGRYPINKIHMVAEICDDCVLQRWQFEDDFVLSNGFSLAQYPHGHLRGRKKHGMGLGMLNLGAEYAPRIDLEKMEETWQDESQIYHSWAPTRERLNEEDKLQWKLLYSWVVEELSRGGNPVVRQVYIKEGGREQPDSVVVLDWRNH